METDINILYLLSFGNLVAIIMIAIWVSKMNENQKRILGMLQTCANMFDTYSEILKLHAGKIDKLSPG